MREGGVIAGFYGTNDGIDFKATSWQISELKALGSCHFSLYMGMVGTY